MSLPHLPRVSHLAALGLTVVLFTGRTTPALAAKAKVQIIPSVKALAPGEAFDVALKFTIDKGWHIYWQNAGDAGLPPKAEWTLPPGFTAGELQFPIPNRHLDNAGLVTNILIDEPVLLATITPPHDFASTANVTIAANLVWLVCEEQCLMERQSVSLSLPLRAAGTDIEHNDETLFRRARSALPVPTERAKYVQLTPSIAAGRLAPSSTFDLRLDVQIKSGFHIQSNRPLTPGLVAADLFMAPVKELFFDPPVFPQPKIRIVPSFGKLSEFEGSISIRVPVEVDEQLPGDSRRIGGVFVYQACSETGTCFPREGVQWAFDVPIAHADADARDSDNPVTHAGLPPANPAQPVDDQSHAMAEPQFESTPPAGDGDPFQAFLSRFGTVGLLVACFLYGLVINATPCVLPLLSIKVLGFVQQAHQSRRRTLLLGLTFGAGVMVFFVVLGLLAGQGKNVLQYPAAVIALATIVMALALSMLGVYTLQAPTAAAKLDAHIHREGMLSSFGKGALAPVLGFACTGPLLAGAFGWATQQPPSLAITAFIVMGLGMASPYMLLGANPGWLSFLPKPGQWMITFERIMGFLLLAMVIWLLHPIGARLGAGGLEWTLVFLVVVALACWVLGRIDLTMAAAKRWSYRGGATVLVVVAGLFVFGWGSLLGNTTVHAEGNAGGLAHGGHDGSKIVWRLWPAGADTPPAHDGHAAYFDLSSHHCQACRANKQAALATELVWDTQTVAQVVRAGYTAFVDFTADYCTVCKANKAIAIDTPDGIRKMRDLGVVRFKGDFSTGDPDIFEMLQTHGRAGVPLNLIYPAGKPDDPIVLRPSLTKDYFLEKLAEAGPSSPATSEK